jgi:hypothetical protein
MMDEKKDGARDVKRKREKWDEVLKVLKVLKV